MSTAEILPEDFETPEERRLRLSKELGALLSRRSEAELMLAEIRQQMVAAGKDGYDDLSRQRQKYYEDKSRELVEAEMALNEFFAYDSSTKTTRLTAANAAVRWHEKDNVFRQMYDVPETEPVPGPMDYDFDFEDD